MFGALLRAAALAEQLRGVDTDALMRETHQARIASSSRRAYDGQNARLLAYLKENNPEAVLDGEINTQLLADDTSIFKTYILKLFHQKDADGADKGLSFTSLSSARSAFKHLLKESNARLSESAEGELKEFFAGLKRQDAQKKRANGVAPTCGKNALQFGAYRALARAMMRDGRPQLLFAHCYLVLTWNLMCRSVNTANISIARIRWQGDSLAIYFALTKSDQSGERLKDPIHLYANSSMPEICPVLALALYLSYAGEGSVVRLFPGDNQAHRFSGILDSFFKANEQLLTQHGHFGQEELGTHSIRKGAVTYTLGGSTAGPGIFSVTLRAQWKQGLVQEKYIKYQAAADQFCGRVVAGLDLESEQFTNLAPHFDPEDRTHAEALPSVFSAQLLNAGHAGLIRVLGCGLASLVYHHDWLKTILPLGSPLLRTTLFIDDALLDRLKPLVFSGRHSPNMKATGVTPHVTRIVKMARIQDVIEALSDSLHAELTSSVITGVNSLHESRAIAAGNVTLRQFETSSVQALKQSSQR